MCRKHRKFEKALKLQVLKKNEFLATYCENSVGCDPSFAKAKALSIEPDFNVDSNFCESVDDRDKGRESKSLILRLKLIAEFDDVLVPIDSFYFIVFYKASQKESRLYILDISFIDDLFPHFRDKVAKVPALEITQDKVQNQFSSIVLYQYTEIALILFGLVDPSLPEQEILTHQIEV